MPSGRKIIVINGPPGTGKTSHLTAMFESAVRHYGAHRVAAVTYTRAAARELQVRAATALGISSRLPRDLQRELPFVGTIHSLAYRAIGHPQMVDKKTIAEFFTERVPGMFTKLPNLEEDGSPEFPENSAEQFLSAISVARHKRRDVMDYLAKVPVLDFDPDNADYHDFREPYQKYIEWKRDTSLLDFEDLLEQTPRTLPNVRVLFVDEAQDSSALMLHLLIDWARPLEFTAFAGDPFQCQPAGTLVRTTDGYLPIEKLDPAIHRLWSYDRNDACVVGRRGGYPFTLAKRRLDGQLLTINTRTTGSRSTEEHRWPFRWTPQARDAKTCVVYMHRKGDHWRVGWCQLFTGQGSVHWAYRARIERADDAWILKSFSNRTEASIYESYVAAQYGLPTIPFHEAAGAEHLTQDAIDSFFEMLDPEVQRMRATLCLKHHGRLPAYPLWSAFTPYVKSGVRHAAVTQACNLLPDLMEVLEVKPDEKGAVFVPITGIIRAPYTGNVYSIDVEPHHLYLSDGLVTHNSIYTWAGAEPHLLMLLGRSVGGPKTLSLSHRLPVGDAAYAVEVLERAGWDEPDWMGTWHGSDAPKKLDGSSFYLARTRNLLNFIRGDLYRAGTPFRELRGRGPLEVYAADAYRILHEVQRGELVPREAIPVIAKGIPYKSLYRGVKAELERQHGGELIGRRQVEQLTREPLERTLERVTHSDYYSLMVATHGPQSLYHTPSLAIGTVHAAKGAEADRVRLLANWGTIPYTATGTPEGAKSEACVAYVGATRHREKFDLVDLNTPGGLYPWP